MFDNGDVSPVSLPPPPLSTLPSTPHLPDAREVWVEPSGVYVPQGPCFLLHCEETPHVLKNTGMHIDPNMLNTLGAAFSRVLRCLTVFMQ